MGDRYGTARAIYKKIGIDTDNAVKILSAVPISMHCWQGDDVAGFEVSKDVSKEGSKEGSKALSGGIQATGNYPGKPGNPEELMADIDKALSLIPGRHRINLHASYAFFDAGFADRDALRPEHFGKWAAFAKDRGLGLDFNPTFFSHPKAETATLSSEDEQTRAFWVRHAQACLRIAEYLAGELGSACTLNIWIPDGFKEIPADRISPRARLKDSLDKILAAGYDKSKVLVTVESKLFGIGVESYTVGSHEFYMNYAARNNILCLLDNGHYHPTESVSDKISSMLLFFDKVALHVTRSIRWDSDHVVLLDDEIKEIACEIVKAGTERIILGLDFFDASINRIAAWVIGMRSMQKALLLALLTPHDYLTELQNKRSMTELMMLREELKMYPAGDVWAYFCEINNTARDMEWFDEVKKYESEVLLKRGRA